MRPPSRTRALLDRGVAAIVLAACAFASACAPRVLTIQRNLEVFNFVPERAALLAAAPPEGARPACERDELYAQWVYSPDPDYAVIARAWPRRAEALTTTVSYCISNMGKTDAIQLVARSGVDAIDEAVLRTIAGWRAKPHVILGEPVRSCATLAFQIRLIDTRRRR